MGTCRRTGVAVHCNTLEQGFVQQRNEGNRSLLIALFLLIHELLGVATTEYKPDLK